MSEMGDWSEVEETAWDQSAVDAFSELIRKNIDDGIVAELIEDSKKGCLNG